MAVTAYRCLRDGGELVVEAPTGIGKTVSSLFPAIKAVGEDQVDQLVYLTAKNSGRQVVREAVKRMHRQGLTLSLLEIQARDKTCACRLGLCSKDADGICPRTQGFFDRLPDARRQLLGQPLLTPPVVVRVADRFQLCPFELSLQMLPWVDLVQQQAGASDSERAAFLQCFSEARQCLGFAIMGGVFGEGALYPDYWQPQICTSGEMLAGALNRFWIERQKV